MSKYNKCVHCDSVIEDHELIKVLGEPCYINDYVHEFVPASEEEIQTHLEFKSAINEICKQIFKPLTEVWLNADCFEKENDPKKSP